jgi:iron complex outermembrane receptor protein
MKIGFSIRCRVAPTAIALLALVAPPSKADDLDRTVRFNIPAGRLENSLLMLSQQADYQIVFATTAVPSTQVSTVTGRMPVRQALEILLQGTELICKLSGAHTLTLTANARPGVPTAASRLKSFDGGSLSEAAVTSTAVYTPAALAATEPSVASGEAPPSQPIAPLSEIIVTAQKREERLQDVPVPVTAISAETLIDANLLRLQDYYTSVPGLSMVAADFRGDPLLTIRGITTGGGFTNPTVGIVVDDVPYGSSTGLGGGGSAPDLDPSDLARVEVLRGPQGTLYGASSIGGLLKYMTVDPSTDAVSGRLQAGTSSVYNGAELGYNLRGAVNVPLGDAFAIRVSGFYRLDPGYTDNVLTGQRGTNEADAGGGRLSAFWRPSNVLSVKLSALFQDTRVYGSSNVEPSLGGLKQNVVAGAGAWNKNSQAFSAIISAKLGAVDFTSLSGYNVTKIHDSVDESAFFGPFAQSLFGVTGAPLLEDLKTTKYSQEFRLNGSMGTSMDWLIGAFYTHENTPYVEQYIATNAVTGAVVGALDQYDSFPTTFEEYAAFTDLTFHVTDKVDIQVGGRESQNRQTYVETAVGAIVPFLYGVPSSLVVPEEITRDSSFTYLVTPTLRLSTDLMVYARLASGYRPGGPNPTATLYNLPRQFRPDTTRNYEFGMKGDAVDHKLSFDMSVYYIDWKDIQIELQEPTGATYYLNGSRAKSEGIELEGELRPLTGLRIAAWVAWNDAVLTQGFPSNSAVYGVAGDRLPYSSRYSGNLSIRDDFPLPGGVAGFVEASVAYVGDRETVFLRTPMRQDLPSYASDNLSAGVRRGPWSVNLFLNNVADRRGVLSGGIGSNNPLAFNYIQPRTAGLSVTKTF